MFLLRPVAEIKDLPIHRTYRQIAIDEKFVISVLNNIVDEVIVRVEQRLKTMGEFRFVELLNPKLFHTYEKQFPMEKFSNLDVYKNILDLHRLKCGLKLVYAADFAKQGSSIQEIIEIIRELEVKPCSGRSKPITTSDSDHPCYICVRWEIVFFTEAFK